MRSARQAIAPWCCFVLLSFQKAVPVRGDVVLSEKIMDLAVASAELSSLAYHPDPPGDGFEDFGFFDEEPDQAIVADRNGYCFAAFRGTTLTWVDWKQNLELGKEEVCRREFLGARTCCTTREGFYKAYYTSYQKELEAAVRKCAKTCSNPNECVVFTGHSQGGAIAAVAGVAMADLNPYVITFGQPPTIEAPCPLVTSERWFRFVNTKESGVGIAYDPVPFVPGLGTEAFGHLIMLGEDTTGVAYIGRDIVDSFGPLNIKGFEAHNMESGGLPFPGYFDRLKTLVNETSSFPIRADGFADSTLCSENRECMSGKCGKEITLSFARCIGTECTEDNDCESSRCDHGSCLPKLGSCMACNEDSDCAGGKCLQFRCSNRNGLMDDNCICHWDSDCQSGRCELIETGECEAKLPVGASCNEDSDCVSDYCTWRFKCLDKKPAGSFCTSSSDCISGSCSWRFRCDEEPDDVSTEIQRASMVGAAESQSADMSRFPPFLLFLCGLVALAMVISQMVSLIPLYRRYRQGYEEVSSEISV